MSKCLGSQNGSNYPRSQLLFRMDLYLLRHGIAENSAATDSQRRLTSEGRAKVGSMMEVLKRARLGPPEILVNSPLVRAKETSDIAHSLFCPIASRETSDTLRSEADIVSTMSFIKELSTKYRSAMFVGHDPHLSILASALVAGTQRPVIEMQKGGVALIELTNLDVPRMHGILRLLLPSSMSEV
jgi:phosphohistidine phosphatase